MLVPGVGVVITRKQRWKQLLLPEIPASRLACLTSGSFRPKLGFGILAIVTIACVGLFLIPFLITPTLSSLLVFSGKAQAMAASITNKDAVESVSKSIGKFSNLIYGKLAIENGGNNLIMSPFSLTSVLSMIHAGAKGNTAVEMERGLALVDEKAKASLGPGYKDILQVLKSNENFTLNTANRLYVAEGQELAKEYLAFTKDNFLAEPVSANFASASEEARKAINGWVESQTNGKITDLIKSGVLSALTRMVLVNAIYFKGSWATTFDQSKTTKGEFKTAPNKVVQADMMSLKADFGILHRVKELNNAAALEMPYKGDRLSMVFILPTDGSGENSLAEVEAKIASIDDLGSVLQFQRKMKTQVRLPKFKVESDFDLGNALKALGFVDMFDEAKADFSGMTPSGSKDLYVSAVVQKAFVEVNEEGAEAAAATAGVMAMRSLVIEPTFICDRPFMFIIKDKLTGVVLFQGRVTDPTKQ